MEEVVAALNLDWKSWLLGLLILFEVFKYSHGGFEWVIETFGFETKKMRKQRERDERLAKTEKDIEEIKKNSDRNVAMFLEHEKAVVDKFTGIKNEIIKELNKLHDKIAEQKVEMDETNKANTKTDLAMLRDRIASGMRYFSHHKDADGNVHISFSDYENMEALYQEYFAKGGNGAFKKMYETEFKRFIIDR